MNTKNQAPPKARFCSCTYEDMRIGAKVFIRGDGLLTTNRCESVKRVPFHIGKLVRGDRGMTLKLNQKAQTALAQ